MDHQEAYHQTVLLKEAVQGLNIKPDGVYVDATMGGAGHTNEILRHLNSDGRLIAFDQDEDAWRNQPNDARLIPVHENFQYLNRFLRLHGYSKVDGVLADLGVSSFHFDTAERGFSIRFDGPMDMRMDRRTEQTAADLLMAMNETDLQNLFSEYGEVRNAKQLAQYIVAQRNSGVVSSTQAFINWIAPVVKGPKQKYYTQVFQALRIAVNQELHVLQSLLTQAQESVKSGGRLSVITFHSLEDRMVKQFLKSGVVQEDALKGNTVTKQWHLITNKPIEPSPAEQRHNPRSRSAKLRVAEKI